MAQEGYFTSKAPLFDGSNYVFWKVRMQNYLISFGVNVWACVANGYSVPPTMPTDANGKKGL